MPNNFVTDKLRETVTYERTTITSTLLSLSLSSKVAKFANETRMGLCIVKKDSSHTLG